MLNLMDRLKVYIDKYKQAVIDGLKDRPFDNVDESITHAKLLSTARRGNESARNYILRLIKQILTTEVKMSSSDLKNIGEIVREEYDILINGKYTIFPSESDKVSYYQLVSEFKTKEYSEFLESIDIKNINGIDEFVETFFSDTYGNKYIENLDSLLINNIEVHGTRKIMVENNRGVWKQLHDFRFKTDSQIVDVADNLIGEDNKGQITEDNCMVEGIMQNGNRVLIGLKPASEENDIFIKKFDGFTNREIKDLLKIGEITEEQLKEFTIYAKGRANICFIGGVNAGKTTFKDAYVGLIPNKYKIGTIGTEFESHLIDKYPYKDIVSLAETKKYNLNTLFTHMLRMNRNILSLEEARSFEVEQLIKGMLRGADGSFSTAHSRTVHDLINNLAWMSLENGLNMDIRLLRYRIASALDIVVRLWHAPNGKRYVDSIDEIITVHDNLDMPYKVRNIYKYDLDKEKIIKSGNISEALQEKFRYYNCTREEIQSIINNQLNEDQYE